MNEQQFEGVLRHLENTGGSWQAQELRRMREALALLETKEVSLMEQLDTAQAQLAEAIKLLGWSKYQLMLWEDYQVENGFEVEDHYVTGKVRQEIETFLAIPAQAEQQEAQGAQAGDERELFNRAYEEICNRPITIREIARRMWMARAALATQPAAGELAVTTEVLRREIGDILREVSSGARKVSDAYHDRQQLAPEVEAAQAELDSAIRSATERLVRVVGQARRARC